MRLIHSLILSHWSVTETATLTLGSSQVSVYDDAVTKHIVLKIPNWLVEETETEKKVEDVGDDERGRVLAKEKCITKSTRVSNRSRISHAILFAIISSMFEKKKEHVSPRFGTTCSLNTFLSSFWRTKYANNTQPSAETQTKPNFFDDFLRRRLLLVISRQEEEVVSGGYCLLGSWLKQRRPAWRPNALSKKRQHKANLLRKEKQKEGLHEKDSRMVHFFVFAHLFPMTLVSFPIPVLTRLR